MQKKSAQSNCRWAWMATATAAAAAVAPHASATTAQISLVGNTLDTVTGDNLSFSTSPGHPFGSISFHQLTASSIGRSRARLGAQFNGTPVKTWEVSVVHSNLDRSFYARANNVQTNTGHNANHTGVSPQTAFTFVTFTLSDTTLPNALNDSNAFLEIEAVNTSATEQTIALLAIFYTESSTTAPSLTIDETTGAITGSYTNVGSSDAGVFSPVPEPSSLALLALGAGGILARRKRRKAA